MPAYTEVVKRDLIEETFDAIYRLAERPAQVVIGSNALADDSDTTFNLSTGVLDPTDRVEGPEGEVMLVTAKSADATPVYTVARGYSSTQKVNAPTGTALLKNPDYERHVVTRWLDRGINSLMNTELPYWEEQVVTTHADFAYAELPEDTIEVLKVRHFGTLDGRIGHQGRWGFEEVPTTIITSGKALRTSVGPEEDLILTLRLPYTWSDETEDATIRLPLPAVDIPVLWASAYGLMRREFSRAELDKIEEWNQEQAIRAGVNLRMIRDAWGEVYRRVDEAKKIHRVPKRRPYIKSAKGW